MERRFRIDLRRIEGDGEFYCPSCGTIISPDDYSELTYRILDIKTKVDGRVEEVIVQCTKCESIICLNGFDALQDYDECFVIKEFNFQVDLETT